MLQEDLTARLEELIEDNTDVPLPTAEPDLGKMLVDCRLSLPHMEIPAHTGRYLEIMAVFRGTIVQIVEDETITLEPGSILMTSPLTSHSVQPSSPDTLAVNIAVRPDFYDMTGDIFRGTSELSLFLSDILRKDPMRGQYLLFQTAGHLPIQHLFDVMLRVYFLQPENQRLNWSDADRDRIASACLSSILFYLYKEAEPTLSRLPLEDPRNLERTVRKYIENNYRTATLRELSRLTSISESALSRNILRLTGQNFSTLVQQFRFQRSAELLETTMLPVADIAASVGYDCQSFFYRRFQAIYHCSPSTYRRQHNTKRV